MSAQQDIHFRAMVIETIVKQIWRLIRENQAFEGTVPKSHKKTLTPGYIGFRVGKGVPDEEKDFTLTLSGSLIGLMSMLCQYVYLSPAISVGEKMNFSLFVKVLSATNQLLDIFDELLPKNAQDKPSGAGGCIG